MQPNENTQTVTSAVSFSGHETFTFRYGWLKKGVDAVAKDATFFSNERAMIDLGVGKNMVQSIRHWCLAARVMKEDTVATHRGHFNVTEIGNRVFSDDGFDPYMEDTGTLWLLHWLIASNAKQATTWFWVFGNWNSAEFTKENIASEIHTWLERHSIKPVSGNSLKRDIDCFVRTYTNSRLIKSSVVEDTLDCPLADLRLMVELNDGKTYRFQRGSQLSLPDEVLLYAVDEFWRATGGQSNTLAFAKIAYDAGSPGRVFKLDEDSLAARLERLEKLTGGVLSYDETSGLKQVSKRANIEPMELLSSYYKPRAVGAASNQ